MLYWRSSVISLVLLLGQDICGGRWSCETTWHRLWQTQCCWNWTQYGHFWFSQLYYRTSWPFPTLIWILAFWTETLIVKWYVTSRKYPLIYRFALYERLNTVYGLCKALLCGGLCYQMSWSVSIAFFRMNSIVSGLFQWEQNCWTSQLPFSLFSWMIKFLMCVPSRKFPLHLSCSLLSRRDFKVVLWVLFENRVDIIPNHDTFSRKGLV